MDDKLTNDYKKIIIENIPLIDVRAPIEFEKGAFLNSINLPLMNNEERKMVGTTYKQEGHNEAVELGHKLVSGEVKEARIKKWIDFIEENPNSIIYCFRGGMRSRISQEWIEEYSGKKIQRLDGGYKAFRNYLIDNLDGEKYSSIPVVIGGYTGTGKTILLNEFKNSIDLEGLANHRGSSFGRHISQQPTQINFENNLAFELIKHKEKGYKYMFLEDEGKNIGRCFINKDLLKYFYSGQLVILEEKIEKRVEITFDEYVVNSQKEFIDIFGEDGMNKWKEYVENSLYRIRKRLGGERYKQCIDLVDKAVDFQIENGDKEKHKEWIKVLLRDYYDPMYEYQISKVREINFKGNSKEVKQYLENLYF